MDKTDITEMINQLNNKRVIPSGYIYEMFGTKYIAVTNMHNETNPCERCAFADCNCMFNMDVPSCNNNVHFEVVKEIKFGLFDSNGDLVCEIEKITNDGVETDCGAKFNLKSLYMKNLHIEIILIK